MRKNVLIKFLSVLALALISGSVWADTVTDVLDRAFTGVTGTTYAVWSDKSDKSAAVYAGQSAGGNESIQLRSNNNNSGIVTTTSGGKVTKVSVTWNANTQGGRTLNVYGSNEAYSAATDLYGDKAGTLIGTIVNGTSTELEITDEYTFVGLRSNSGAMYLEKIEITWDAGSEDPSVTTVVTIDDSGLKNTDVHTSTAAGVLTAVVKAGDNVLDNAAVTWTSSKTEVATIDARGAVTLVAAGTTTITASYAGVEGQYKASSATYTLTVVDTNAPGSTADNPYTVAQARAAIDAGTGVTGVYAKGIVSEIVTAYNSQYGNITYNISENGSTEADQLQAYRGFGKNGEWFTSEDDIQVGDVVVVYGNLKKYTKDEVSTYEFDAGNQLVSLERQAAAVEKPVISPESGDYEDEVSVTITCATEGAAIYYTTDGTEPSDQSTKYTTAIILTETTTVKAIAYKGNDKSIVATATYNFPTEMTIAEVRAQTTGSVQTSGVVTSVSGKTAYIQDGTAAIVVYGSSNLTCVVGDKISVKGALKTYKGLLEIENPTIEVLTQGNAVNPEVMTIAAIQTDFSDKNLLQGLLVKIVDATVTAIDGQNTTIAQEGNSIVVRGISGVELAVDNVVTLVANIGCYDIPQLANPTDVIVKQDQTPVITLAETTIEVPAEGADKEIDVTFKNIDGANAKVNYVTADGGVMETDYDWFDADVENGKLVVIVGANTGDARTGYLTVSVGDVTSPLVTVTQEKYIVTVDYATLPFSWEGGKSADLLATNGVTAEGLGAKDYADSNAPYQVKLDDTGDFIQVKTDQRPGVVTVGVKMLGGSNASKITVQGSADGQNFTDVEELAISGDQNTILELSTVKTFAEDVRYVRLVFTKGSNVGVGPIKISTYVAPTPYPVKFDPGENVDMHVFDAAGTQLEDGAMVLAGTTVLVSAGTTDENYEIDAVTVTDADNGAVTVTKGDDEASWTFIMPASKVTISVTAKEKVVVTETLYTLATTVELGKHYIIVGKKDNSVFAVGEQTNNNRAAVAVNVADAGVMVASDAGVAEFVIKGCEAGYVIYDENEAGFLYAASSSKNYLRTSATPFDNGKWSIYIDDENGVATIVAKGENTNNSMRFNSSSSLFSCYAPESTQLDVYLYVKDGDTGSETETFYKSIEYEFATVCLPFNATLPKGVKAYMALEYSDDAVTLTELTGNVIPKETGVVVASESAVFVPFVKTEAEAERVPESNLLVGVTDYTEVVQYEDHNQYALQVVDGKATFCLVEGGAYAANTAYLLLPQGQSNSLTIRFGDATRIANAMAEAENARVYDLSGRAVNGIVEKGIYIVNGKKIVVK